MKLKNLSAVPVFFALAFAALSFTGCDNGAADSGGPVEYSGETVNIINSIWDGSVWFEGNRYAVRVNIPDSSSYSFYINNVLDDTGTYVRKNNTATLTSTHGYTKGQVIGTAVLTGPDTAVITNYANTGRAGSYTVTRRQ
ncbi:MAG: hypothetical protein FWH38_10720 [Treponema sp.]|nr:hypothetical protein [Treponema sp.]MCL2128716.1 hypothetical protein [Treponema sp.]